MAHPDTPPNGAASTGALEAVGDAPAPVAAPAVHDCNRCRWWHPDGADVSATIGACTPLHMATVATGGGCVDHYLPDEED